MIYFARVGTDGPIKIGSTDDLCCRVRNLQSHYRKYVTILHNMDYYIEKEREIQKRFSHLRIGKTEEFRPDPSLEKFIGKPLQAKAVAVPTHYMLGLRIVRLDADLVTMSKGIAKRNGITTSDYIGALLRPILEREWAAEVRRMTQRESK